MLGWLGSALKIRNDMQEDRVLNLGQGQALIEVCSHWWLEGLKTPLEVMYLVPGEFE